MSRYPPQPFFGFKVNKLRPWDSVKGERYFPVHGRQQKYAYGSKLPLVISDKKPFFKKLYMTDVSRFAPGDKLVRWGDSVIVNVVPWKKPMQPQYPMFRQYPARTLQF